jgi:hypothetical protein
VFSVAPPTATDTSVEELMASLDPEWVFTAIGQRNIMEIKRDGYTIRCEDGYVELTLLRNPLVADSPPDLLQMQADLIRAVDWLKQ